MGSHESSSPSRRTAIARLLGVAAIGTLPVACRREHPPDTPAPVPPAETPTGLRLPTDEPIVRIRIAAARTRTPLLVGADDGWIEVGTTQTADADLPADAGSAVLFAPAAISRGPRGWSIIDARGFRPTLPADVTLHVISLTPRDHPLALDGQTYGGTMRLVPRPRRGQSAFDIVNHIRMEHYLPGVLVRELYSHWHATTFEALAIAARSYAWTEHLFNLTRRHFDLHATTRSQVYGGRTTHRRALDAVGETRGRYLAHHSSAVPGYYSACCGGTAADARDGIGPNPINALPPLYGRSQPDVCVDAPLYRWILQRPLDDACRRFRAYGTRIGAEALQNLTTIETIDVADANRHGRPRTYAVTTDAGQTVLDAASLRAAFDHTIRGVRLPTKSLWSSDIECTIDRTARAITIHGRGHGHGVGLCQHGAETLAVAGRDPAQILDWYYPGVEIASSDAEPAPTR